MMSDHPTIWNATKSIIEFGAELIQFTQVRGLISPKFDAVGGIGFDERFRDMLHHGRRVFRIQPDVRIPTLAFANAMDWAVVIWQVADQSDSFGRGYSEERGTSGSLDERRSPNLEPETDFEQQACLTDCHQIARLGSIGMFIFIPVE